MPIYVKQECHRCSEWAIRLLGLMILALAWVSVCQAEMVDRIIAIVNDDIILNSELEQAMAPYRKKASQEGLSELQQQIILADQRKGMLDQLINEKLTGQQVARLDIKVSDDEANATIEKIKQSNRLSDESFLQMIDLEGMSFETYREKVKMQLLQNRLVNREVRSKIVITEEDVKAFYDTHQGQYGGQSQYHLRHILLKVEPAVGEDERKRVKAQIQAIHQRLVGGEDFSQLAASYSQSPTAADGGDLGLFELRLLASPIRQALEGLNAHQYTGVVDSEQGYQILYIEEIVKASGKTLEEATPDIQEKLYAEVVEQKFQSWLKELRQKAHIQLLE